MPLYEIEGKRLVRHQSVPFRELEYMSEPTCNGYSVMTSVSSATTCWSLPRSSAGGRTPTGVSTCWPWIGRVISWSSS